MEPTYARGGLLTLQDGCRQAAIYIVDDEPKAARTMAVPLLRSGHRTRVFQNPKTALAAFTAANHKPALLITDLLMPEINGLELAHQCKQLHPPLKIIITGWFLDTRMLPHYRLGPITVLDKPVSPVKLTAVLQTLRIPGLSAPGLESDDLPDRVTADTTEGSEHRQRDSLIYVVDDKAQVADMISNAMDRCGYRTEVFRSPVKAAAALDSAASKPALLITDFSMPEMDGLELMRRCRQVFPQLKVILISGTVSAKALRGCGVGADFVLDKPLALRELVAAVRSVFDTDANQPAEERPAQKSYRLWDSRPDTRPLIYVVDDEFVVAQLVSRQLLRSGYRTRVFENPMIALSTFSAADPKPALLITDLGMPGMGGEELARRCRQLVPGLPVIIMSGSESTEAAPRRRHETKADVILAKPFTPESLLARVSALVDSPPKG